MSAAGVALEFAVCRERLERAVARSCDPGADWASSVSAGVHAALEFAAEDPAAALVLTDRATSRWKQREPEFVAMVDCLAGMLSHGAPTANPRLPGAAVVVATIARQVNLRLEAGPAEGMMEIAPDLAFLALMPFIGFADARRVAQPTAAA